MKTEFTEEFAKLLVGGVSPAVFAFSYLCFCVGFAIQHANTVTKAVKKAKYSPDKFDFWYWFDDNFADIVKFVCIAYGVIRFPQELGFGVFLSQYPETSFAFVLLGLAYERINKSIRKFRASR